MLHNCSDTYKDRIPCREYQKLRAPEEIFNFADHANICAAAMIYLARRYLLRLRHVHHLRFSNINLPTYLIKSLVASVVCGSRVCFNAVLAQNSTTLAIM